jgi:acyl-CoA thioesterase
MERKVKEAIFRAVEREPLAQTLKMELMALEEGFSAVEMTHEPERMDNIYGRAHGGAIYSLIDEAFEAVAQSDGTIAVALNVNVTYASSPEPGARLRAEAKAVNITKKTASYDIRVTEKESGRLIASCNALAFRTGKPIPFLDDLS